MAKRVISPAYISDSSGVSARNCHSFTEEGANYGVSPSRNANRRSAPKKSRITGFKQIGRAQRKRDRTTEALSRDMARLALPSAMYIDVEKPILFHPGALLLFRAMLSAANKSKCLSLTPAQPTGFAQNPRTQYN
jgi:hypothetical protein